ncbi:predicted protein [Plenodomus lingam JN3]|uniref:Uncharacterized protein n=1 Tax=Leptosphaeria maculans (strain JN3 / isolate v23.1.3 / race Av1-4-5-6-7-8) TaxID=985895 RepID=E5A697_LEPMJ|nr:predicted protein [Plenodomus lingam JN3]CBX99142.1 predicted protein [Plenodomus lingam JN3]
MRPSLFQIRGSCKIFNPLKKNPRRYAYSPHVSPPSHHLSTQNTASISLRRKRAAACLAPK